MYEPAKVLSVHDGLLDWHLWTDDGQPLAGAVVPDNYSGQIYGRYSVRFRSGNAPGYGFAFLLWPNDNNPDEGEIDYPETSLAPGSTVNAYVHVIGSDPGQNYYRFRTDVSADTGFHIATIEWQPGRITFILDGKIIGVATKDVPSTPFHWVLQAGANYSLSSARCIRAHIRRLGDYLQLRRSKMMKDSTSRTPANPPRDRAARLPRSAPCTPSASPVTPLGPRTARAPRSRACSRVVKPGSHHARAW